MRLEYVGIVSDKILLFDRRWIDTLIIRENIVSDLWWKCQISLHLGLECPCTYIGKKKYGSQSNPTPAEGPGMKQEYVLYRYFQDNLFVPDANA